MVEFEKFHESLADQLHPNHYLMILLKRHMVGLYSTVLTELEAKDLERVGGMAQGEELIRSVDR